MEEFIRAAIINLLAEGVDVATAYRAIANAAADVAARPLDSGHETSRLQALPLLNVDRDLARRLGTRDRLDREGMFLIVSGGGVANVPDAKCVAEHLKGRPKPSRDEIEKAFAACTK